MVEVRIFLIVVGVASLDARAENLSGILIRKHALSEQVSADADLEISTGLADSTSKLSASLVRKANEEQPSDGGNIGILTNLLDSPSKLSPSVTHKLTQWQVTADGRIEIASPTRLVRKAMEGQVSADGDLETSTGLADSTSKLSASLVRKANEEQLSDGGNVEILTDLLDWPSRLSPSVTHKLTQWQITADGNMEIANSTRLVRNATEGQVSVDGGIEMATNPVESTPTLSPGVARNTEELERTEGNQTRHLLETATNFEPATGTSETSHRPAVVETEMREVRQPIAGMKHVTLPSQQFKEDQISDRLMQRELLIERNGFMANGKNISVWTYKLHAWSLLLVLIVFFLIIAACGQYYRHHTSATYEFSVGSRSLSWMMNRDPEQIENMTVSEEVLSELRKMPVYQIDVPDNLPPTKLKQLGNHFTKLDGSAWLPISGHDWVIIDVKTGQNGKSCTTTADLELRPGYCVVFLSAGKGKVRGYLPFGDEFEENNDAVMDLELGSYLRKSLVICRTDYIQKASSGRITIQGDNRYSVLPGAKLVAKELSQDKENLEGILEYTFEYQTLDRVSQNFGDVHPVAGTLNLDLFQLKFPTEKCRERRLGLSGAGVPGLDLRAKYGFNVLGVVGTNGSAWSPPPTFEVHVDDLCVCLHVNNCEEKFKELSDVFGGHASVTVKPAPPQFEYRVDRWKQVRSKVSAVFSLKSGL